MKKKHLSVLQHISSKVPKELLDKLLKTVKVSPSWEKDVKAFLETGETTNKLIMERFKDKKQELQNLFDAGMFSRTIQVVDKKIEKLIDEFYNTEIDKAIKDGILPPRKEKLLKKTKQHGKRVLTKQD